MISVPNALLFDRPHTNDLLERVYERALGSSWEFTVLSEYKGYGTNWVGEYIYSQAYDVPDEGLSIDMAHDIISRDRVLRELSFEVAYKHVRRFWNAMNNLFDEKDFRFVASLSIDCYIIDVIYRIAEARNIPVISFIGSFMKEYARFTVRGERQDLGREVSDEETAAVLAQLSDKSFLPHSEKKNVTKTSRDILSYFVHRKISEKIYHPIWRRLHSDPIHTVMSVEVFRNAKWGDIWDKDFEKRFLRLDDVEIREDDVYFPMHLIPEATTDYWCDGVAQIGYESYVISAAKASPSRRFLIKEHPAMYGLRRLEFYDHLNALDNVEIIHPMESSNELLSKVNNVMVDDGTVGIEAAIRGKNVLALCDNYYSDLHPGIVVGRSMEDYDRYQFDADEANYNFIRDLLSAHFVSDYNNDLNQANSNIDQLASAVTLLLQQNGIIR